MAVNANTQTVSAQSEEKQNMQESQTMPPQLRAARLGKQRIVKTIILTVTLLFLFVPLVSMFLFTIRHPLSGKWSFDPWIAIFTGDGSAVAPAAEETAKPKNWALFIGKNFIGDGSEELGGSLMTMFFYTLAESNDAPRYILFMNSGVKLVVENDQVVEHLQTLQAKGSEILVCGTCLKFFDLEGNQKIGTVSNMYDISERMHMADKVITL